MVEVIQIIFCVLLSFTIFPFSAAHSVRTEPNVKAESRSQRMVKWCVEAEWMNVGLGEYTTMRGGHLTTQVQFSQSDYRNWERRIRDNDLCDFWFLGNMLLLAENYSNWKLFNCHTFLFQGFYVCVRADRCSCNPHKLPLSRPRPVEWREENILWIPQFLMISAKSQIIWMWIFLNPISTRLLVHPHYAALRICVMAEKGWKENCFR